MLLALLLLLGEIRFTTEASLNLEPWHLYDFPQFALIDDQRIAVVSMETCQLLILSMSGKLLHRAGDCGEGPRDFLKPFAVYWIPEDRSLLVNDYGNTRFTKWSLDGKQLAIYPKPWGLSDLVILDAQEVLAVKNKRGRNGTAPRIVRYHLSSEEIREVWRYQGEIPRKYNTSPVTDEMVALVPWDSTLLFDVGPHFIATTFTADDRVILLDRDGQPSGVQFRTGMRPRPFTLADRNEYTRYVSREKREKIHRLTIMPEYWPRAFRMKIDRADRIWIMGYQEERDGAYPVRVFDREGRLLGEGDLPFATEIIGDQHLYCWEGTGETTAIQKIAFRFQNDKP